MRINALLDQLAKIDLANVNKGGLNSREFVDEHLETVIDAVNIAITNLHTRFLLKRRVHLVNPAMLGTTEYTMPADTASILDILQYDVPLTLGVDYMLNTPTSFTLMHVFDVDSMVIDYRAKPEEVTVADVEADSIIDLPDAYASALFNYVASRYYRNVVSQLDGDLNESSRYMQAYFSEIEVLENASMHVNKQVPTDTFTAKGFI